MKIIILLFLLVGCGKQIEPAPITPMVRETSDALLQPYLDSFLEKLDCFNRTPQYSSLRMTINWDGMSVAGECTEYSDGSTKIVIDGPTWISISDVNRERLIYHELGHCALGLDHINQDLEPEIMTPGIREILSTNYVADYDLIINDLFSNNATECTFAFVPYTE